MSFSFSAAKEWTREFGIGERRPPSLFLSADELSPFTPQAHLLRRRLRLLSLMEFIVRRDAPLIYFKQIERHDPATVFPLHRTFWNHGGAPILVLISKERVHVYSGMSRPVPEQDAQAELPSLVTSLDRVVEGLSEFLASVEFGHVLSPTRPIV